MRHSRAVRPSTVVLAAAAVALAGCTDLAGPGGTQQLAFVRDDLSAATGYYIYQVDFATGREIPLTARGAGVWIPAWSPDGSQLAFNSDQDGTGSEIFVMSADGSGVRRLTNFIGSVFCPSWSPDGRKIIFEREGGGPAIYVMNADGSDTTRLLSGTRPLYQCPLWSPDGSRIAFVSMLSSTVVTPFEIFLVNADGTGEVNWSNNPDGEDDMPAWSPDGKAIAFYSYRDSVGGIYVMNVDGSGFRRLVGPPGRNDCPAWSPDGTWIAFTSNRDAQVAGNSQIYAVTVDGAHLRRLTHDLEGDTCARWRP